MKKKVFKKLNIGDIIYEIKFYVPDYQRLYFGFTEFNARVILEKAYDKKIQNLEFYDKYGKIVTLKNNYANKYEIHSNSHYFTNLDDVKKWLATLDFDISKIMDAIYNYENKITS